VNKYALYNFFETVFALVLLPVVLVVIGIDLLIEKIKGYIK